MYVGKIEKVLAFSEVEQALRAGLVDGAENTPSNMYTQGMNAVQPMHISNHGYLGYAVIVNSKFWDELPDDLRHGAGTRDGRGDGLRQQHRQGRE